MHAIKSYSDYLIALRNQTSDLRFVKTEAIQALQNLHNSNPKKYAEYKARYEESQKPKQKSARAAAYDKKKYIQEHPELSVDELRNKAKERLERDRYGLYLSVYIPNWITVEQVLESIDSFEIADLITANGKPVPRQTLIQRCIKRAVADRRIDEKRLREIITNQFISHYKNNNIALRSPNLFEPIKTMINNEATVEELVNVTDITSLNCEKMVRLINSKNIRELTDEELERLKQNKKKSKNALKRAKRRAEKEAALKKALEEKQTESERLDAVINSL